MGSGNDFLNSAKRSVLSFILVNVFSLTIVYIIYPMIEKPEIQVITPEPYAYRPAVGGEYYFRYFWGELAILILSVFLGIVISSFILKIGYSFIIKSFRNPWFTSFMYLVPIFFLQLSVLDVEYDNPFPIYPYMILVLTFFTILTIMRGVASISPVDQKYYQNEQLFMIVKKKSPVIITLLFLLSYFLGIRSTVFYFYRERLGHLGQEGVNLHIGILVLSLQILILQLILSFLISRIPKPNSLVEVSSSVKRKSYRKSRGVIMLILLIATFFISLLLFFISLFPGVFMTGKYEWILIFRNPYHMDFEFINSPPSNFHWFGTDLNSYDVFSILLFSISAFLFISYIISLIRFRIALDFKNATDNIIMRSNRMNFYQVLGSFPSIPILMLISILLFPLINWLTFYLLLLLIMSIFSWVDTSELLEFNKETKGKETFLSKMFRPIILKSTSSIFLNLIILSYLDVTRGNFPRIGRLLRDSQYNMPTTYWWTWLFPIVIIAFTIALLRSDRDPR